MQPLYEAAGVAVRVVPRRQLSSRPARLGPYLAAFPVAVRRVAAVLKAEGADLVHTNSLFCLYGPWAARLAGLPNVLHAREIAGVGLPARIPFDASVRLSTRVIALSEAIATGLATRRRVDVIADCVDTDEFRPGRRGERIRRELGVPEGAPLVGFAARLDPWKGAEVFVRAAAEIAKSRPDAHFAVFGGEIEGHIQHAARVGDLAAELHLEDRIHFAGWTYRPDAMPEAMAAIDLLLHTSIRPEPFGLVLLEAMASGLPVVAADAGGVPEVVERDVTGRLTPPGDHQAAARAVLEILGDDGLARAFGTAGRQRAIDLFQPDRQARLVEDVWREAL